MEVFNKIELLNSLDKDTETFDKLISYVPDIEKTIDAIEDSILRHNDDSFRRGVHFLKGISGTMHFERFSMAIRLLEFAYVEDREDYFDKVHSEWKLIKKVLELDTNKKV